MCVTLHYLEFAKVQATDFTNFEGKQWLSNNKFMCCFTQLDELSGKEGRYWDTDTYDVSAFLTNGQQEISLSISRGYGFYRQFF